ncbi:MAG: hypothetical protein AB3N64_01225 [Puniceicoccaceae bacterium]
MKTKRLMQSGILNTGEPKHYSSWSPPEVPKLNMPVGGSVRDALYRRQKAHAPKVNRGMSGWMQIWHSLRKS